MSGGRMPGSARAARLKGRLQRAAAAGGAACLLLLAPAAVDAQLDVARIETVAALLDELVSTYGVSGDESRVRAVVERRLPEWAAPEVDEAGNLWVRVGTGAPLVVFIAHLDEVGFQVTDVLEDGTLVTRTRGGFFPWLWEATPALVHTEGGPVPGVFMPRDDDVEPPSRRTSSPLRVDVGTRMREATEALGVRTGDFVTNPKKLVRLAGTRATGRSFDDRAGTAALVLALQALDRDRLQHEVAFVWSVGEETGLAGARAAARALGAETVRVHAVDTFVSSAAPVDLPNFAAAPIGEGPVLRGVDNSSVTPRDAIDTLMALAARHDIPLQLGATNGSTDGTPFRDYGAVHVPVGWPLRYSHSPIELIDLVDVVRLADLVRFMAEEW